MHGRMECDEIPAASIPCRWCHHRPPAQSAEFSYQATLWSLQPSHHHLQTNSTHVWNSPTTIITTGTDALTEHLPYLTLPLGWAGCYTCPALRPYQFGPMRNPDVTIRSQWSAVRLKSAVKPNKSPATWDRWRVVWLFLSCGLLFVSSSPSD